MAWDLKVSGVSKKTKILHTAGVSLRLESGERSSLTFVTRWADNYIPARFAPVLVYAIDGVTLIYGGIVLDREVDAAGTGSRYATCVCADWWIYLDWAVVTLDYTSPVTTKTILTDVVAALPVGYGFTVDPAQVNGLTYESFSTGRNAKASEVVRGLAKDLGYRPSVSPALVVAISAPGSVSAPFTLVDAATHCQMARWRDPSGTPANTIVLSCGPDGPAEAFQVWVADGLATSWVTDLPAAGAPPVVVVDDGVTPFVATVGTGAMFEWNTLTSTLSVGTYGTPAAGVILTLGPTTDFPGLPGYLAQYPFTVTATSGGTPVITEPYEDKTITNYSQGVARAAAILAERNQAAARELEVVSLSHGWRPDQDLTVALTQLDISNSFTIGPVDIELTQDEWWEYSFTAVETSIVPESRLDLLRRLLGKSGSGSSSVFVGGGSLGSGAAVLASPFFLGGSRTQAIFRRLSLVWLPVVDYEPYVAPVSFTGLVRVDLWARNASISVQARLYNVTDSVSVATSSVITATTATSTTFTALITAGKTYRLEMLNGALNEGAYALGSLEAA